MTDSHKANLDYLAGKPLKEKDLKDMALFQAGNLLSNEITSLRLAMDALQSSTKRLLLKDDDFGHSDAYDDVKRQLKEIAPALEMYKKIAKREQDIKLK